MGETKLEPLRVDFDRRVTLERHGSEISSDAGLPARSQLAHALGLTEPGAWDHNQAAPRTPLESPWRCFPGGVLA